MKEIPYKIYLEENEMPKQWYNVRADMKKKPAPILNPATHSQSHLMSFQAYSVQSWQGRSWMILHRILIFRRKSGIFIRCTDHLLW